jgi:hypothetical protein
VENRPGRGDDDRKAFALFVLARCRVGVRRNETAREGRNKPVSARPLTEFEGDAFRDLLALRLITL